ncbi:MAG: ATP-dependent helicase [Hungatella sp.]
MAFHEAQLEAIRHQDGPMMVLAGPGSGKTTVITQRTKYLIEMCGVDPSKILVITFTRAAAREMQERFERLMEGKLVRVNFGTFHSVFFMILKYAYRYTAANIARDDQRIQFLRELMERQELQVEDEQEFITSILGEISSVKGEMINLEHYYAKNCSEEIFKGLYDGYEDKMRKANLIDFDDMLVMCHDLFVQRRDILEAWQKKYQYILIDEFQDINLIQYRIIRMMAKPRDNLFIVGDDDQSVYRFRGAKPEIMLGFGKDYPETKTVLLGKNYRSTQEIVAASLCLIAHNQKRYQKQITTEKGSGRPVVTCGLQDPQEETMQIVLEIQGYVQAGYRLQDIAVLYRTNLTPRLLVEKLMEYNIPFSMKDALPNLYEHWISQNILAYIRAAHGDLSRSNLLQIINRPNRYISRDSLMEATVSWEQVKSFYQDKNWMVERVEQLEYDLNMLSNMPPVAAVNYIRKAVGYDDYLKTYAGFRRMKPEELLEIPDQLKESSAGFKTMDAWFAHMVEYKEQLRQQMQSRDRKVEGVSLMTMHSAKGLEFPIVYLMDANEGITPHRKAMLDADIEEERRMFYVAMTRAKERLHVYYVRERYGKKQDISRFIPEYLGQARRK